MTFKDLKKRVCLDIAAEQSRLFERLQNKPFWIWNIEEHKQEDIRTNGDCCFNHIISLPQKDGQDKPLYDYEKIIFDFLVLASLDTQNGNSISSRNKHINWNNIVGHEASSIDNADLGKIQGLFEPFIESNDPDYNEDRAQLKEEKQGGGSIHLQLHLHIHKINM